MHGASKSWRAGVAALALCSCGCGPVFSFRESDGDASLLDDVNVGINHRIVFAPDQAVWGRPDYWATPRELLARGHGDCEDYAVAKFFALQRAGIRADRIRLVVVLVSLGSLGDTWRPHMVVAYLPSDVASDDVLILDNLLDEVRPLSRRPDLRPLLSFDTRSVWRAIERGRPARSASEIVPWAGLLERMNAPH